MICNSDILLIMKNKEILLICLTAAFLGIAECQLEGRRRRFRDRLLNKDSSEKEETDSPIAAKVGVRNRDSLFRSRQRALGNAEDNLRVKESRPRLRPNRRRPGRRRPGRIRAGGRRFPAARRPLPVYYDDYGYDEYYDDYYDAYYDYYEEEEPEETVPTLGEGLTDKDLISKLWLDFIKEKQEKEKVEEYDCEPLDDVSYYLPDDEQCDKYLECNIKGELREHLCPDGFVFDISLEKCDYPVKVNCTGRPLLQEPQPSVNCSRANGFFAWPANMSCQNFWDCREGIAYKQTCPVGVIFDPGLNTCATPDQSSRKECTEGEESFLGFQCPRYAPDSVLRFGNHDRLPHPEDCQSYFTCLVTGGPRLANCGRKKVFNNATGQCSDPKNVPGCETYWIEKLKEEDSDEYYYDDY